MAENLFVLLFFILCIFCTFVETKTKIMKIWDLKEGEEYTYISPKGFARQVTCVKVKDDEAYFYYPELKGFGGDSYSWHNRIEIDRYIH